VIEFGLFPQRVELGGIQIGEFAAFGGSLSLHLSEPFDEFTICSFESDFRIELEESRDIHDRKEQVSHFGFDSGMVTCSNFGFQFAGLFAELVEDAGDIRPIEANTCGAACELVGLKDCGK